MKTCKRCVLNDNMLSVRINEDGICNYCESADGFTRMAKQELIAHKEQGFIQLCEQYKHLPYQVVHAYSGGKDSTYGLYLLRKKYNLSVLTVTFDNGFLTDQSIDNIKRVTSRLGVDNMIVQPSFSKIVKIFRLAESRELFPPKALERASSICTACIGLIKSLVLKEAIIRRIPLVSFGWTPGQVNLKASFIRLPKSMILANQNQIMKPIVTELGDEYRTYFIDPDWLTQEEKHIPLYIYPLLFNEYNEQHVLELIKTLGWKNPQKVDSNSTNCTLNSYANYIHFQKYGFNPYSLEVAELVREGSLSREEGLIKLQNIGEDNLIQHVRERLEKIQATVSKE